MSAGLWSFFWRVGAPAPTPTPTPAPTPPPGPATPLPPPPPPGEGSGGGKGHKPPKPPKPRYTEPPVDFWDVREQFLRATFPEEMPPAPPPDSGESRANQEALERAQRIAELNEKRSSDIIALRGSDSLAEMKEICARLKEVNSEIASLTAKQGYARFFNRS